jgi:type 1 glutamine amidotransferase
MNRMAHIGVVAVALVGMVVATDVCVAEEASPARNRAEVEAVLAKAPRTDVKEPKPLHVVLLAGDKDHKADPYAHDYPLWQKRWELLLGGARCSAEKQANLFGPVRGDKAVFQGAANVKIGKAWHWPTGEQFANSDVIIAFCYFDWDDERLTQMRQYLERGGGLVAVHAATWPLNKQQHAAGWSLSKQRFPRAAEVLGVGGYGKYRHGSVEVKVVKPEHPLCTGLPETIHFDDETYWPPTPRMDGLEVLATSDEITDDQGHKAPQPVLWTYTCGKGRVVGCQPGHSTWTFDDPYFRIVLLRGAAWAAGQSPYRFDGLVLRDARVTK